MFKKYIKPVARVLQMIDNIQASEYFVIWTGQVDFVQATVSSNNVREMT